MATMHVACGSSAEYVPHVAAMLHSVAEHRGELELDAHFVHGPAVDAQTRALLAGMVERDGGALTFHELGDERIAGLRELPEIPATMWYRTFLPELLVEVDRVLYLDADTIAVDSLEPLWRTDVSDAYVAAVTNVWEEWNRPYPVNELGLASPDDYFNSGVLLMNLDALRSDDGTARVLEAARSGRRLLWGDQDALNVALGHRRVPLHPRWNVMNSILTFPGAAEVFGADAIREAREKPAIRHFEGPSANKPWHILFDWEGREDYLRHRGATPWPEVALEGATLRNRWRRRGRERARRG